MTGPIPNYDNPLDEEVTREQLREFLFSKIESLEADISDGLDLDAIVQKEVMYTGADHEPITDPYEMLARLFLEYALLSTPPESLAFAYKAVSLDPDIYITDNFVILKDWFDPLALSQLSEFELMEIEYHLHDLSTMYVLRREQGQIVALEGFLDHIRQDLAQNGDAEMFKQDQIAKDTSYARWKGWTGKGAVLRKILEKTQ